MLSNCGAGHEIISQINRKLAWFKASACIKNSPHQFDGSTFFKHDLHKNLRGLQTHWKYV